MGTKNDPGKYDCYAKAEPDEPMFVLLARDRFAPALIEAWAMMREGIDEDTAKVDEAMDCADAMRQWRKRNR